MVKSKDKKPGYLIEFLWSGDFDFVIVDDPYLMTFDKEVLDKKVEYFLNDDEETMLLRVVTITPQRASKLRKLERKRNKRSTFEPLWMRDHIKGAVTNVQVHYGKAYSTITPELLEYSKKIEVKPDHNIQTKKNSLNK